jgi:hypothetical protein
MILSDARAGDFRPMTAPVYLMNWLLPYLVGRFFLRSPADLAGALRPMAAGLLVVSVMTVLEAVTRINPWDVIGLRNAVDEGSIRAGLLRARASLGHPIYLGMMLALLHPWAFEAARRARAGIGPKWWRSLPWAQGLAVVGTVCRGAILAMLGTCFGLAFLRHPRWRVPLAASGLLGLVLILATKDILFAKALELGNEDMEHAVTIGDKEYVYNGSLHRLLLFDVYWQPLTEAGLFGYGHHMGDIDVEDLGNFWSIDSHVIDFTLRFGYVGMGLFILLTLSSLAALARAARTGGEAANFAGALAIALLTVTLSLFSVAFQLDYGVAWLFLAGLSTSLGEFARRGRVPGAGPAPPPAGAG